MIDPELPAFKVSLPVPRPSSLGAIEVESPCELLPSGCYPTLTSSSPSPTKLHLDNLKSHSAQRKGASLLLFESALSLSLQAFLPSVSNEGSCWFPSFQITTPSSIVSDGPLTTTPTSGREEAKGSARLQHQYELIAQSQQREIAKLTQQIGELKQQNEILQGKLQHQQNFRLCPANSSSSLGGISASGSLSFARGQWMKGERLGEGAFATVYVAMHLATSEFFAVKEFQVNVSEPELTHSMENELEILQQLAHPNIVKYLGMLRESSTMYVFQEYVAGGSVPSVLRRFGGVFPEPVIVHFLQDVLRGLAYLHENRVIHRDIKGDNILLTLNGTAKLADFGTAKHWTGAVTPTRRRSSLSEPALHRENTGGIHGSTLFMAPEVLRGKSATFSSDIWSVGCFVIEMATGLPPWQEFHHISPMQQLFTISRQTQPPKLPESLAEGALQFLSSCLQIDCAQRPSCQQLLAHSWLLQQYEPCGRDVEVAAVSPGSEGFPPVPSALISRMQTTRTCLGVLEKSPGNVLSTRSSHSSAALQPEILRAIQNLDLGRRCSLQWTSGTYTVSPRGAWENPGRAGNRSPDTARSQPAVLTARSCVSMDSARSAFASLNTGTSSMTSPQIQPQRFPSLFKRREHLTDPVPERNPLTQELVPWRVLSPDRLSKKSNDPLHSMEGSARSIAGNFESFLSVSFVTLELARTRVSVVRDPKAIDEYLVGALRVDSTWNIEYQEAEN